MARKMLAEEKCPNCGRNEIEADSHHGDDLKRNAFLKRASKSLLIWLGVFAWMLLEMLPGDRLSLMTFLVLALLGLAWTLVVVVRAYRDVYRASSAGLYPDARHTCSVCGHSWTACDSPATAEYKIDEIRVTAEDAPQNAEADLPAETPTADRRGWKLVAISFGLILFINALVMLVVDTVSYGGQLLSGSYLAMCLPATVVLPALGGGAGALLARGYGSTPWRGAMAGIWMGAVTSIAIWLWGLFGIGPGV